MHGGEHNTWAHLLEVFWCVENGNQRPVAKGGQRPKVLYVLLRPNGHLSGLPLVDEGFAQVGRRGKAQNFNCDSSAQLQISKGMIVKAAQNRKVHPESRA